MGTIQKTFKRHELKYILDPQTFQTLYDSMQDRMQLDDFGLHTITSIYYDTPDYRLIRHSIDEKGRGYKEKLRLRAYGRPQDQDAVAIELKKKYDRIVYKRRIFAPLCQARAYLSGQMTAMELGERCGFSAQDAQILREIDWFMRVHPVTPQVMIAYDRLACFDKAGQGLRITFDRDLRWRNWELDLAKGSDGLLLRPETFVLMEVKIPDAMPLWMTHLFSDLGLRQSSFSKYANCYREHLLEAAQKEGVFRAG